MSFDPYLKRDIGRLRKAIDTSNRMLLPYREFRQQLIKDYSGHHYGKHSSEKESSDRPQTYINLWALAVDVHMMALAGGDPQILIVPELEQLLPFAKDFEAITNKELRAIKFKRTVREWVKEAFFGLGVLKIGEATKTYIDVMPGHPQAKAEMFADIVDLDDFFIDMEAKHETEVAFMGNRYRAVLESVRENPDYDEKVRSKVGATHRRNTNEEGRRRICSGSWIV